MSDGHPTPQQPTADTVDMSFALNQIAEADSAVVHALLFTSDGLTLAGSGSLGTDTADSTAAAMSALKSLTATLAPFCGAEAGDLGLQHVTADFGTHTVFILGAAKQTGVAVSVRGNSGGPAAQVALHATLQTVHRLRPALEARARSGPGTP